MAKLKNIEAECYLLKALHYANQSAACIESVIIESQATKDAKMYLQSHVRRMRKVVTDMEFMFDAKGEREIFKLEMKDQYRIDAFMTMLMQLNETGWEAAEEYLNKLLTDKNNKQP